MGAVSERESASGTRTAEPVDVDIVTPPSTLTRFDTLNADASLSLASMEGLYEPIVEKAAPEDEAAKRRLSVWAGYWLAGAVGAAAFVLHYLPVAPFGIQSASGLRHPISAAIIAIITGVLVRNLLPVSNSIAPGCKRIVKKLIPVAIVLTGAGMNLTTLATIGPTAFVVIVLCIGLAVSASYYLGRAFGLGPKTAMLIGVGTGICGNSAIVAVAPLLDAEDDDLALSLGTVNFFGLLTMLACPLIGGWLSLSDVSFGLWSGTTIHAVPQVVAAGFAYSADAGTLATLIKLVRVTLLAPLMLVLAMVYARRHAGSSDAGGVVVHYARLVPWFVWGFVGLALVNTLGLIPTMTFQPIAFLSDGGADLQLPLAEVMTRCAKIFLTIAMAAIGLELHIRGLAGVGARALTTGLVTTLTLGTASLLLVLLLT